MAEHATQNAKRMMLYDARKKSVGVAYLLWLFFGLLGAHRFYAGKVGTAVAILLMTVLSFLTLFISLAVAGVWLLVDAFLIPGMIRDHNVALAQTLE